MTRNSAGVRPRTSPSASMPSASEASTVSTRMRVPRASLTFGFARWPHGARARVRARVRAREAADCEHVEQAVGEARARREVHAAARVCAVDDGEEVRLTLSNHSVSSTRTRTRRLRQAASERTAASAKRASPGRRRTDITLRSHARSDLRADAYRRRVDADEAVRASVHTPEKHVHAARGLSERQ
jgi:hypothetical protein